jgi:hypothetical protein
MSKKPFTVTLYPDHMKGIEESLPFHNKDVRNTLYFFFDSRPNIDIGDTFTAKILLEMPVKKKANSLIQMDAEVIDIAPPLAQPPTEQSFKSHSEVMCKFVMPEIIERMKKEYMDGEAKRNVWTVYFKKLKSVPTE